MTRIADEFKIRLDIAEISNYCKAHLCSNCDSDIKIWCKANCKRCPEEWRKKKKC